jgi:hypothetical protein
VIGLLFVALETAAVKAGDGQHAATLPLAKYERAAMLNTAAYAPGILSFVLPKLGVVALLCRIFNPSRRWKLFLWTFVGGSGLIICGCIIILYAQCNPMKAMWTPGVGKCWSSRIVVDYSIFAGGMRISISFNHQILTARSTFSICRYLSCQLSDGDIVELTASYQKKILTPCSLLSRGLVSLS